MINKIEYNEHLIEITFMNAEDPSDPTKYPISYLITKDDQIIKERFVSTNYNQTLAEAKKVVDNSVDKL